MLRGLAVLGTLVLIAWLSLRPDPADETPPVPRSDPRPIGPEMPGTAEGSAGTEDPVNEEDSSAPQETEDWLGGLLAQYERLNWRTLHWHRGQAPWSPLREDVKARERRILELVRSLPKADPRFPALFRLAAHVGSHSDKHPDFAKALHALAESGNPEERRRGLSVVAESFKVRPEVIHAAIREADPELRLLGVRAVGATKVKADWVLPEMATVLADPDREVRLAAFVSLEQLGDEAASLHPAALSALKSADPALRRAAVDALTKMRSVQAETGDALVEAAGDEDRGVAHEALWAVAMFGLGKKVPVDLILLDTVPGTDVLTTPAVMSLGQHGPEASGTLPRLQRTIRACDNFTREYALQALRKIQRAWEPAFETFEWCMGHAYIPTKQAAAEALFDFGPRAIPVLERHGEDRDVGKRVQEIIEKLRTKPERK
jgi:hypothetical protein